MTYEILFFLACFCGALLLLRFCVRFFRLCLRFLWGGGLLLLVNTFGFPALSLGINPFTLVVAWVLGLPGVGALLLLKHLLPG